MIPVCDLSETRAVDFVDGNLSQFWIPQNTGKRERMLTEGPMAAANNPSTRASAWTQPLTSNSEIFFS